MKTAYEYAVQQLEYAHCNFNNAPPELGGYFYFKIKAAEALIDDIRRQEAERLDIKRFLDMQDKQYKPTLLQRIRGFFGDGHINA
jgi:hypothetical protein